MIMFSCLLILLEILCITALILPMIHNDNCRCSNEVPSWDVLKCLTVLELSVIVFAGAVYNFSLALIVTLLYTPVVMLISPSASRFVL